MTKQDRIIMMKRERPKRVPLPNGRTFIARYQRVTRAYLLANLRLAWPYKKRAAPKGRQWRRRQIVQDRRSGGKLLKLVKIGAKASITQKTGKKTLNELPNLHEKGTSRIKNKKIKKLLQSDLANSMVDMGTEYDRQKLG